MVQSPVVVAIHSTAFRHSLPVGVLPTAGTSSRWATGPTRPWQTTSWQPSPRSRSDLHRLEWQRPWTSITIGHRLLAWVHALAQGCCGPASDFAVPGAWIPAIPAGM